MTKPKGTQTLSERFAKYSESSSTKSNKKSKLSKTSEKTKPQSNKPKVAFKKTRPNNKKQNKKKIQLTSEQLDKDLDAYRMKDKDAFKLSLDKELEEYSKGVTTNEIKE